MERVERVIEEKWVRCGAGVADNRLDVLRRRADHLARKIEHAPTGTRRRDEAEHAALLWAIAELTGIGDEIRRERAEQAQVTGGMLRRALKRAEHAEALAAQFRVKSAALKAEIHRLTRERSQ